MHQNRFRLGLRPDPAGDLTALPRPPSWIKRDLLLREGVGHGKGGKGRNGREDRGGEGEGGEGKGRESTGSEETTNFLLHPQFQFSTNIPVQNHI